MQVRTAVIPAAGLGTRFLPASKAVPKELMPIGDTPALQIVIDEALGAGIDHVVVVEQRSEAGDRGLLRAVARGGRASSSRAAAPRWPSGSERSGPTGGPASSTRTSRSASATPSGAHGRRSATSRSPCCCPTS